MYITILKIVFIAFEIQHECGWASPLPDFHNGNPLQIDVVSQLSPKEYAQANAVDDILSVRKNSVDFIYITDAMEYQMPPTVGVQIGNQIIAAENSLTRSKRSPYSYGYRYSTGRGHGSGYGHGSRYGNCYNCRRPGRVLGTAAVVGGAAFAGGFIGSAVGK